MSPRRAFEAVAGRRVGMFRPLTDTGRSTEYWRRHVLIGVCLTEVAAGTFGVYAVLSRSAIAGHRSVVIAMLVATLVATPLIMALPLDSVLGHPYGVVFFYGWSIADTAVITVGARLDGGAASPVAMLLFLTLAYMALAYPPSGVVVVGATMTLDYLFVIGAPHITLSAAVIAVVMACFTAICSLASANAWNAHDAQQLLLRTEQLVAATDPLTGVLNRRAFLERLRNLLTTSDCDRFIVCLIDLDRFKAVNDSAGHAAGDAVLVSVTQALGGALRETDTLARLGGDEFAVLAATQDAAPRGRNVAERLCECVAHVGGSAGVTASIGVVVPAAGETVEAVLHRADVAMYDAKRAGGNGACFGATDPPVTASPAA